MKNLRPELIALLKKGSCTPRLSKLAAKTHSKATTIHYNIKQLESQGVIKAYKAVFDYKKVDAGFCTFVLVNLDKKEYKSPEDIGSMLAEYPEIESIDIITGEWEMLLKVRTKDISQYYEFSKKVLSLRGIERTQSLNSLFQIKTEFVKMQ
ncbi:MAG: Lrp/AsnC family transcriptional regulator [Candidatus Micrarchaeaceae archaeon]|jgi:DNA-binding Lrp family transcriptional regulator